MRKKWKELIRNVRKIIKYKYKGLGVKIIEYWQANTQLWELYIENIEKLAGEIYKAQ